MATLSRTYELQVAQNPIRARMCGFGEKDRRPMDPPPILRLIVRNKDGTLADVSQMDVNFYMVVADIYSADKLTPCTLVANPSTQPISATGGLQTEEDMADTSSHPQTAAGLVPSRNLTGSTVASGNLLLNLENKVGVYFVFQDISVRSEGVFTLKFSFALPPTTMDNSSSVMATVFTEPFTIYSAKRFPGMTESTALSKCFAKQGVKIPIRGQVRVSRTKKVLDASGPSETRGETSKSMDRERSESEEEED